MSVPDRYEEDREAAMRIGRHVQAYMDRHHLNQTQLAELLEVEPATISRILSGARGVGVGLALRISRRLVISPHDLFLHEPRKD